MLLADLAPARWSLRPWRRDLIQSVGVLQTFAYLGVAYLVVTMATGYFMQNPPDWLEAGGLDCQRQHRTKQRAARITRWAARLRTWQWWALWLLLFLNISAGISLISQESPMFQEIAKVSAIVAAGMVGIVSIGNAVGRIFWAWTSDASPGDGHLSSCFWCRWACSGHCPASPRRAILTAVSFIILMCYGGGFGTMPAFAADYFGSKNVGPIYGLMLTAWGCASAFGPLLIAHLRQSSGSYVSGLHIIAGIMAVSMLLPILVSPPKTRS